MFTSVDETLDVLEAELSNSAVRPRRFTNGFWCMIVDTSDHDWAIIDPWEIIDALRTTTGTQQARVSTVADQLDLHPRQVTIALGCAAEHPDEIEDRIAANQRAQVHAEQAHQARQRLLDRA